jgi:hypothetical protein
LPARFYRVPRRSVRDRHHRFFNRPEHAPNGEIQREQDQAEKNEKVTVSTLLAAAEAVVDRKQVAVAV